MASRSPLRPSHGAETYDGSERFVGCWSLAEAVRWPPLRRGCATPDYVLVAYILHSLSRSCFTGVATNNFALDELTEVEAPKAKAKAKAKA